METPPDDDAGALDSIRRFLEWKSGEFGLLIVSCNDAATRDAAIRELGENLPGTQLRLALPEGTSDPLEIPLHSLHGPPPAAIHLVQLERSVPSDESNLLPLHALNLRRGQWEKLGCPVVFWVPDYLLGLLLRHAPDFASWRSGSPHLSAATGKSTSAITSSVMTLDSGDVDELVRPPFSDPNMRRLRLAELEKRLEPYSDPLPTGTLPWLREMALLLALEKRPDEALKAAGRFYSSLPLDQMAVWRSFIHRFSHALRAAGHFDAALHIAEDNRDRVAEMAATDPENRELQRELGRANFQIGNVMIESGRAREALEDYGKALVSARRTGDRGLEGCSLGNLGLAYANLGDVRKAIGYYEQQLEITREIGDRRGEGNALGNVGNAHAALGDVRKAIGFYEAQLVIARVIGDRRGEGAALGNLGISYKNLGDARKAIGYHEEHLEIAREIGDRRGEGKALGNLGLAYATLGGARQAIGYYDEQLVIAREIWDRRGEGNALFNSALAHESLGERDEAVQKAALALAFFEAIEDPNAALVRQTIARWKSNTPADAPTQR
jgi:tetratricopeptide (TPR) repeat protein